MKTPSDIWEKLSSEVEPYTVAEGDIKSISISFKEGGVVATTLDPMPTVDQDEDFPSAEDVDEIPENESVFIYEDYGVKLKKMILEEYHTKFDNSEIVEHEIVNTTVTKESIETSCRFSVTLEPDESQYVYDGLAEGLVANGEIDNKSDFAFGTIRRAYYTEDGLLEDGWEFDGTIYRYTDEPYEWWSEPENIEEWADFVSDSEREREHELNKERYIVHQHPTEHGLDDSNSYIKWFKDTQEVLRKTVDANEEVYLTRVSVDNSRAKLWGSIKL